MENLYGRMVGLIKECGEQASSMGKVCTSHMMVVLNGEYGRMDEESGGFMEISNKLWKWCMRVSELPLLLNAEISF